MDGNFGTIKDVFNSYMYGKNNFCMFKFVIIGQIKRLCQSNFIYYTENVNINSKCKHEKQKSRTDFINVTCLIWNITAV